MAFIIDELEGDRAGTEKQLLYLMRGIAEYDVEPVLITLRQTPFTARTAFGFPAYCVNLTSLKEPGAVIKGLKLSRYISLKKIVVAHIFFRDASVFTPFFCKLGGSRVVQARRDLGFSLQRGDRLLLKVNRPFVDRVVANCMSIRQVLINEEKWPENRVDVIYNGLDFSDFDEKETHTFRQKYKIPPEAPIIGIVANLNPWKRHEDLLEAFKLVWDELPACYLVVVGDGPRRACLEKLAHDLGIAEFARFTGSLDDPVPIIKQCSVCVLCSETEGLSNAIIEYLACGKPVVATDVGGNIELIQDNHNGCIVPVHSPKKLAGCILGLLENREKAEKMGKRGQLGIKTSMPLTEMVKKHAELYESLAGCCDGR